MQPKLLRVLEEKQFERIGGTRVIQSDFRLIAATNQNLETMLTERRFRKDLFYRLNVIPLHIPPLRERRDDILPLAQHLLQRMTREAALQEVRLEPEAQQALIGYRWPGNVRELVNVLERVMASLEGDRIGLSGLPFPLFPGAGPGSGARFAPLKDQQARSERRVILQALEDCAYNKARAASRLGIHRTLLYKKMRRHGITTSPQGLAR
jgi:DNA-binding NtrC family response regulator